MKRQLAALLSRAMADAIATGALPPVAPPSIELVVPRERQHGDLASNVALIVARAARMPPHAIAKVLLAHLHDADGILAAAEVAGPGFLNFTFAPDFWRARLRDAHTAGDAFGRSIANVGRRFHVEFVSANPTGPLTVGHGRNAVLGDAIVRLLEATGAAVHREYYFNNAGRQMTLLGESTWARYQALCGRDVTFPEDGYQGDYIKTIAQEIRDRDGDGLTEVDRSRFRQAAETTIFADIRRTLDRMGVHFDMYVNEDALHRDGKVGDTLAALRTAGHVEDRDGAVWLRAAGLGLTQDRVLVKSSGEAAYRLPDIAYHGLKLNAGYDLVVDVLGADHIDEHEEVVAALRGLGRETRAIRAVIYQFVTLTRGGEQVKMSTRRAQYVTLDELLGEVGVDAARFFFLLRKADSHLEFDLELAKQQSTDNPVYYVQYAHARVASVLRQAAERGIAAGDEDPRRLVEDEEMEVIRQLVQFPDVVEGAAADLEPHRVAFYLMEFAAAFHRYYNRHRIMTEDVDLTRARLQLVRTAQRVLRNGLGLLGVSAPERM